MRSLVLRAVPFAAALSIVAAGCGESAAPVAPEVPEIRLNSAQRSLVGGVLLNVLQRSAPLSQSHSAEALIGPEGGVIAIPEAGFSITFPAGAVSEPVTIRATALPGSDVAYRFEPHGLVFGAEPVITQELSLTEAVASLLTLRRPEGGYVQDPALLANGTAAVLETRPARVDLLRQRLTFGVRHFSEYVVSTERGGYIGSSGDVIPADNDELETTQEQPAPVTGATSPEQN